MKKIKIKAFFNEDFKFIDYSIPEIKIDEDYDYSKIIFKMHIIASSQREYELLKKIDNRTNSLIDTQELINDRDGFVLKNISSIILDYKKFIDSPEIIYMDKQKISNDLTITIKRGK